MTPHKLKTAVLARALALILAGSVLSGAAVLADQGEGGDEKNPVNGREKPRPPGDSANQPQGGAEKGGPPSTPSAPKPSEPARANSKPARQFGAGRGTADSMMGGTFHPPFSHFVEEVGETGARPTQFSARDQIRSTLTNLSNQVASEDRSPKTQEVLKKLDEPISMSFAHPTPLLEVLKYIKSATQGPKDNGIPIYVDPDALNAHMRLLIEGPDGPRGFGAAAFDPTAVTEDDRKRYTSVTIDLEGVPLRISLRLLLKQLDLAYCVRDGVLIISSVEGVYLELVDAANAQQGERERKDDAWKD